MAILIGKIVCLFLAFWFVPLLGIQWSRGQYIHWVNLVIPAATITGFITLTWLI